MHVSTTYLKLILAIGADYLPLTCKIILKFGHSCHKSTESKICHIYLCYDAHSRRFQSRAIFNFMQCLEVIILNQSTCISISKSKKKIDTFPVCGDFFCES